jgi:hypothetical protein
MKTIHWLLLLLVLTGGCTQKFISPYHFPSVGYLVVEGYINADTFPTNFILSRVTSLDSQYYVGEPGAVVNVESQNGAIFPIPDVGNGAYSGAPLPLDVNQQYRVRITTSDGQQFLSDFTPVNITPPIDSVSWKTTAAGVNIYVSTHDPLNKIQYYQWKYDETWEYNSAYESGYEYLGGMIVSRPPSDLIYTCWQTNSSTDIIIGNSAKLKSNIIYEEPVTSVPYANSNKLTVEYSILVRQYALTEDWYNFNQKIQKNTENLGSIFDAQPSELVGNIHCLTNPSEPVVGFIGCTNETDARIFIDRGQLPGSQVIFTGYEDCTEDTIANTPVALSMAYGTGQLIPVSLYYVGPSLAGIVGGPPFCVDCRLNGGFTQKPAYWQ